MQDDMEDGSSGDKFYDIEDEEMKNVMDMMDEQLFKQKDKRCHLKEKLPAARRERRQ